MKSPKRAPSWASNELPSPHRWTAPPADNPKAPHTSPELVAKIEEAFRRGGLEHPRLCDFAIYILVHMGGPDEAAGDNIRDAAYKAAIRHCQPASRGETEKELSRLGQAAQHLLVAIQSLHLPALTAIGYNQFLGNVWEPPARPPSAQLLMLQEQIGYLLADLERKQPIPEDLPQRGRSVVLQSVRVAVMVGEYYEKMTGNPATIIKKDGKAGGPFIELLASVFEVLEIKNSLENSARSAVREIKRRKQLRAE